MHVLSDRIHSKVNVSCISGSARRQGPAWAVQEDMLGACIIQVEVRAGEGAARQPGMEDCHPGQTSRSWQMWQGHAGAGRRCHLAGSQQLQLDRDVERVVQGCRRVQDQLCRWASLRRCRGSSCATAVHGMLDVPHQARPRQSKHQGRSC